MAFVLDTAASPVGVKALIERTEEQEQQSKCRHHTTATKPSSLARLGDEWPLGVLGDAKAQRNGWAGRYGAVTDGFAGSAPGGKRTRLGAAREGDGGAPGARSQRQTRRKAIT